jgi:hypothetical protein
MINTKVKTLAKERKKERKERSLSHRYRYVQTTDCLNECKSQTHFPVNTTNVFPFKQPLLKGYKFCTVMYQSM